MGHEFWVTVYPEDVDATGFASTHALVRYLARARSEAFSQNGKSQVVWEAEGYRFPAYRLEMQVRSGARLGERLEVETAMRRVSAYRLEFGQRLLREEATVAEATVEVVFTDTSGRLLPLP